MEQEPQEQVDEVAEARRQVEALQALVSSPGWDVFRRIVEVQVRNRRAVWMSRAAEVGEVSRMNWDLGGAEFGDAMLRLPETAVEAAKLTIKEAKNDDDEA